MSTARHLATIERLCSRAFPAERGGSDVGSGGPGYHIAELLTSDGFLTDDGILRSAVQDQYEAERDGISALLSPRWGEPHRVSLWSVFLRTQEGVEHIPEPWRSLSTTVPDLHLWRAGDRWVALGIAQWGPQHPCRLLAVVTDTDPP